MLFFIRAIRTTIRHFYLAPRRFLCCLRELRDAGLASRQESIDDFPTVGADLVTMRFRNLVDQAMGTQQTQGAGDSRRLPALFRLIRGRLREQQAAEVTVAKAVDGKFA